MSIRVVCPHCQAALRGSAELLGGLVQCYKCRQSFYPSGTNEAAALPERSPKRGVPIGLLVGSGAVTLLLIGGGVLAWNILGRPETRPEVTQHTEKDRTPGKLPLPEKEAPPEEKPSPVQTPEPREKEADPVVKTIELLQAPRFVALALPQNFQDDPLPAGAVQRFGSARWRMDARQPFALNRDGTEIAVERGYKTIEIWDARTGARLRKLEGPVPSGQIRYSPNSRQLLFAQRFEIARLRDATTGETSQQFPGRTADLEELTVVTLSGDGKLVAGAAWDDEAGFLSVWDVATGKAAFQAKTPSRVSALAFSPDRKRLASVLHSGAVLLWDVATGKATGSLKGPDHSSDGLAAFTADGNTLITVTGTVAIRWNVTTQAELGRFSFANEPLAISADGKVLVVPEHSYKNEVHLHDPAGGKPLRSFPLAHRSEKAGFSGNGQVLAVTAQFGEVHIWDLPAGTDRTAHFGHSGPVRSLQFAPDNRTLISSNPAEVFFWDLPTGKSLRQITHFGTGAIEAMSADGKVCVLTTGQHPCVGSPDRLTALDLGGTRWDSCYLSRNGDRVVRLEFHDNKATVFGYAIEPTGGKLLFRTPLETCPRQVLFSPDGKYLALGDYSRGPQRGTILLDAASGKVLHRVVDPPYAFSPTNQLTTANEDGNLMLWDPATGTSSKEVETEAEKVRSVAWSPDGRFLAVGEGGDIHILSGIDFKPITRLAGHHGPVLALAFSSDGKLLASGANDTTILLWDATRFGK
jgi:WD40 repeat protein